MNSTNQIPSEIGYTKYLNLGFSIAIAVFHVTTIFFTAHVIYSSNFDKKSTKLDRISNSFFIFLACRGFGAVLALPYPVYLTVYWSAEGGNNYEPYAHLWLGLGSSIHGYLSTLSALLLTLERCFALTFPIRYNSRLAKWFPWLTLAFFILWSIIVAFYVLGEIPLDVEKDHWLLAYVLYRSANTLSHFSQCYRLFYLLFVATDEKNKRVMDKILPCMDEKTITRVEQVTSVTTAI
ncbi:serpentine type 7TM GPCR chemoreceptor srbc domain-containing protein [Ditylenchus destructor]|uniref:Serpentine type 7TM GPCR chemoreceptor srbc domain-containing protein n=1 Tax=Ditylenchus destructor TaxID=166010 RepID=A0AAD4MQ62_9BILA|nr:serpentine type 7TM GPCR chemoreceptor srbc domain-containing protein [Ditylenchus destructor]